MPNPSAKVTFYSIFRDMFGLELKYCECFRKNLCETCALLRVLGNWILKIFGALIDRFQRPRSGHRPGTVSSLKMEGK